MPAAPLSGKLALRFTAMEAMEDALGLRGGLGLVREEDGTVDAFS